MTNSPKLDKGVVGVFYPGGVAIARLCRKPISWPIKVHSSHKTRRPAAGPTRLRFGGWTSRRVISMGMSFGQELRVHTTKIVKMPLNVSE